MHLRIRWPGRALNEVARRVHAHRVVGVTKWIHRNSALLHVPAPVENLLGYQCHAVRHLGRHQIFLRRNHRLGNAVDQPIEIGLVRLVGSVGGAILARGRGVRVRCRDEHAIRANLRFPGNDCLGRINVVAANQAVVDDHNRQSRIAIISHNRPRMQRIMRLGSEAFVEGTNHLHRPQLGGDIRLGCPGAKWRGRKLGGKRD